LVLTFRIKIFSLYKWDSVLTAVMQLKKSTPTFIKNPKYNSKQISLDLTTPRSSIPSVKHHNLLYYIHITKLTTRFSLILLILTSILPNLTILRLWLTLKNYCWLETTNNTSRQSSNRSSLIQTVVDSTWWANPSVIVFYKNFRCLSIVRGRAQS